MNDWIWALPFILALTVAVGLMAWDMEKKS